MGIIYHRGQVIRIGIWCERCHSEVSEAGMNGIGYGCMLDGKASTICEKCYNELFPRKEPLTFDPPV